MVLDLNEVDPPAPRTGESIVQTRYAGICGSDTPKLLRPGDFTLPDPWRPGHEIVGTDTTGRIVAVDPLVPCGGCQRCAAGDIHLCPELLRIGWDEPGGFAEQTAAPTVNLYPIPAGLDPLHAVLADPAAVAIHGIRCHPIPAHSNLTVIGAGTIGLLTALYAATLGHTVTVAHRAETPPSACAIPAAFRPSSQLPAHAFDVVIDAATGNDAAPLELALHLLRDGGSIVVQNAYHPGSNSGHHCVTSSAGRCSSSARSPTADGILSRTSAPLSPCSPTIPNRCVTSSSTPGICPTFVVSSRRGVAAVSGTR